jgi:hypothetical protein
MEVCTRAAGLALPEMAIYALYPSRKHLSPAVRALLDFLVGRFAKMKETMRNKDLHFELRGEQQEVAVIRLTRGSKRNAINDALVLALRGLFEKMPTSVRAAVIDGEGDHFCAGLDLS